MNLLAIETSSSVLSVALKKGKDHIYQKTLTGYLRHSENLIPLIDGALKTKKLKLTDIKSILMGRGPGSFTGLRIGFSTLKGLLPSKGVTSYGADCLDLIAEGINSEKSANLVVCLKARHDKIHTKFYCSKKGFWYSKGTPLILSVTEIINTLPGSAFIAGDALERYLENFKTSGKNFRILPKSKWFPKASSLIALFQRKSKALKILKNPKDFFPLYLRLSEAEERIRGNVYAG